MGGVAEPARLGLPLGQHCSFLSESPLSLRRRSLRRFAPFSAAASATGGTMVNLYRAGFSYLGAKSRRRGGRAGAVAGQMADRASTNLELRPDATL
jgi:hypothetical protein